jgi:hypothetical protein
MLVADNTEVTRAKLSVPCYRRKFRASRLSVRPQTDHQRSYVGTFQVGCSDGCGSGIRQLVARQVTDRCIQKAE